jgi:hypothetical protein
MRLPSGARGFESHRLRSKTTKILYVSFGGFFVLDTKCGIERNDLFIAFKAEIQVVMLTNLRLILLWA